MIFLNGFNTAEESDHYMNLLSMVSAGCSPGTIFSLGIVGLVNYDELSFVLLWRMRQAVLLSSIFCESIALDVFAGGGDDVPLSKLHEDGTLQI